MFKNLTTNFAKIVKSIKGQGRFSEKNIDDIIKNMRHVLIEADVALSVINSFLEQIKNNVIGTKINDNLNPSEAFLKLIQDSLIEILGNHTSELELNVLPPAIILVAGLQGTGKTTSVAKLAKYLQTQYKKKIFLTSTDIYRPAALEQLQTLADEIGVDHYLPKNLTNPLAIVKTALAQAKKSLADIVIVDTAGRLHINNKMMTEIKQISNTLKPQEILYVLDCMTGQDAAISAKAFHELLPLTGTILTKTDGDARGGAALSVCSITNKPIKFIGTGEKIDDFEIFHPSRLASRILDQGDILSALEHIEKKVDQEKSAKLTKKLTKGKSFNFNDLKEQLDQVSKLGDFNQIINKIPGMTQINVNQQDATKNITKNLAIINSMTKKERQFPDIINPSRKKRIANGSGNQIVDVNRIIKQLSKMQKMMKKFSKMSKMKKLF